MPFALESNVKVPRFTEMLKRHHRVRPKGGGDGFMAVEENGVAHRESEWMRASAMCSSGKSRLMREADGEVTDSEEEESLKPVEQNCYGLLDSSINEEPEVACESSKY